MKSIAYVPAGDVITGKSRNGVQVILEGYFDHKEITIFVLSRQFSKSSVPVLLTSHGHNWNVESGQIVECQHTQSFKKTSLVILNKIEVSEGKIVKSDNDFGILNDKKNKMNKGVHWVCK